MKNVKFILLVLAGVLGINWLWQSDSVINLSIIKLVLTYYILSDVFLWLSELIKNDEVKN